MTKIDRQEAKRELAEWKALLGLVECNQFGCEIHIRGFVKGLCVNKKLIPVINHNIKEIEKFLKGEKNKWE